MKSQRRHQLQTNTLAKQLEDLPAFFQAHSNKILVGLVIVALLIFLVRYRISTNRQQEALLKQSLSSIRSALVDLRTLEFTRATPQEVATERKRLQGIISTMVDSVLQSDDPQLKAEAFVARGDLYWNLASAPALPGTTTQPSALNVETREDLLKNATQAYEQVVSGYSEQANARIAAQFGLAAIAENRGDWDKADQLYGNIAAATDTAQMYKFEAQMRKQGLPQLKTQLYVGAINVEPTTEPSTMPSMTPAAATGASTMSATTQPAH